MNIVHKILIYIIMCLNIQIFAYSEADDTVKVTKEFPEVKVTGKREMSNIIYNFFPGNSINNKKISESNVMQIDELLKNVPGVLIKDYGLTSGIKTASIWGTSSCETLIRIDGLRLNSTQTGLFDLSIIPSIIIENIEVIKGASTSIFGANAMGGVMNLYSINPQEDNIIKAKFLAASYQEYLTSILLSKTFSEIKLLYAAEYLTSKGNFPIETNQFGKTIVYNRENADISQLSNYFATSYNIDKFNFDIKTLFKISDKGVPGAVLQNKIENKFSRIKDKDFYIIFNSKYDIDDNSKLNLMIDFKYNEFKYSDTESSLNYIEITQIDSKTKDLDFTLSCQSKLLDLDYMASLFYNYSDIEGNILQNELNHFEDRTLLGFSMNIIKIIDINGFGNISFYGGFRDEYYSDVGNCISSSIGFALPFEITNMTLKGNISYNYRPPSFNEMYYYSSGNNLLKTEKSLSNNISIELFPFSDITLTTSLFYIITKDKITLIPKNPYLFIAQNFGEVHSKGFELMLSYNIINEFLNISFFYLRQLVTDEEENSLTYTKKIPYIPEEVIGGSILIEKYDMRINLSTYYSSYVYSITDNSYNSIIPSYFTLNLSVGYKFELLDKSKLFLSFDINNLLNEDYCIVKNYPMPQRQFKLSLNYKYN